MDKVKIITKNGGFIPTYETPNAAGADIRTNEDFILYPGNRILVHTGIYLELPEGYEAQIRSRSGLALKKGIIVYNSPGTVDSDYRGEVCVILYHGGDTPEEFHRGDRIAQMVIAKHEHAEFELVEELSSTERGEGGFGHTGK